MKKLDAVSQLRIVRHLRTQVLDRRRWLPTKRNLRSRHVKKTSATANLSWGRLLSDST